MTTSTGSILARPDEARIDRSLDPDTAAARMLVSFGACLADRQPVLVREYLDTVPNSAKERQIAGFFNTSECLVDADMRMPTDMLRAAVSFGVYRSLYRKSAPTPSPSMTIDYDAGFPNGNPQGVVLRFADCVYRADMAASRALLFSLVKSAAEKVAMTRLSSDFGRCVDPTRQLHLNQTMLRAALAESAYRISKATVAGKGS